MTTKEYIYRLNDFKRSVTNYLHYNIESPQRIQQDLRAAIEFLESVQTTGQLKKEVELAVQRLKAVLENAKAFSKQVKPDPNDKDLGAVHHDDSFWYQQVIGSAESAINELIRHVRD
ncbi:hypothetical protein [Spirosoma montaniterrae]|uniref:Uncharacterized protein n=1 Tax=Spirosoma montaniterrae TaxID=1178516 RepID=A0A1P9WSP4_9BACT|nr:hypothetical protein [Spirosoma montaniterrae]AQG78405.1 hypothetical protein AWR27_03070 [Spirosoma montaniterrae]